MASLIEQLTGQALDPNFKVSDLLRKVKVAAIKLGLNQVAHWVDSELAGYGESEPLPEYRYARGHLRYKNLRYGWQPIMYADDKGDDAFPKRAVYISVGEIQELLSGDGDFMMTIPPSLHRQITEQMGLEAEIKYFIQRAQFVRILEAVRTRILDWAIELDKRGISGEGISFSSEEKRLAHDALTSIQNLNISTFAGNIGNVNDHATVAVTQNAQGAFDPSQIAKMLNGIRKHLDELPDNHRAIVEASLDAADTELLTAKPVASRIRSRLVAIQNAAKPVVGWVGEALVQAALAHLMGGAAHT